MHGKGERKHIQACTHIHINSSQDKRANTIFKAHENKHQEAQGTEEITLK